MAGESIWQWALEPSIFIGLALWTAGYLALGGPLRRRYAWGPPASAARQAAFHAGTLVALAALVSPLDHLADTFLLSAHMVQHMLLLIVAPPLWLLGVPPAWFDHASPRAWPVRAWNWLTRPLAAYLIFNAVLIGWHVPAAYDAALTHDWLHIVEHASFLAAALIGWWPVLGWLPRAAPRANPAIQVVYLFFMMLSTGLLGAVLTLARAPLYPYYLHTPGVSQGLALPVGTPGPRLWGLSALADQQLSGLIMWIPGNLVYIISLLIVLAGWLKGQEQAQRARERAQFGAAEDERSPSPGVKS